ncbi:MAG: site-2 protease family protein [Actinomycetes bacterium]
MNVAGMLGVLFFAVGVAASIALHEVGHLLPAKRFGVKVTQYMVGFGPTVWSRRRGETEYGVKVVPLGGYIRMIGMFPPHRNREGQMVVASTATGPFRAMVDSARAQSAEEVLPGDEDRVFYRLKTHQKLVVMLGGPTMNLVIAGVLFTMAMSGFGVPQLTTKVDSVVPCVPAVGADSCAPTDPRSPALTAGVKPGDVIVAIDGQSVSDWTAAADRIRAMGGQQAVLTVQRGGVDTNLTVDVVATQRPTVDNPNKYVDAGYVGIRPALQQVRQPITAVPGQMWDFGVRSGSAVLSIPSKMVGVWQAAFGGATRDATGPVSLVGVGRFSAEVAADKASLSWRFSNLLMLLAALNMALFLFNLIPLLPLDGGHVAGALYEGAKRQVARWRHRPDPGPVDVAKALPLAYGVAFALIGMSALLMYADVVNPIRLGG